MQPVDNETETALLESYVTQSEHYARSLELIRGLPAQFANGEDTDATLQRINQELEQVAQLESQIGPLKAELPRQAPTNTPLQEQLNGVQGLLEEMLEQITVAMQHAESAKQRLRPQMELNVQSARMRNAYRQFKGQ